MRMFCELKRGSPFSLLGEDYIKVYSGGVVDRDVDAHGLTYCDGLYKEGAGLALHVDSGILHRLPLETKVYPC